MPTVFFSYSHADEVLRNELEKQLAMLLRRGVIEAWHDRRIAAGEELHGQIDSHIESDDIILLLVSPDFLASDYCYDREMTRALERHEAGDAIVIPVILRACDWQDAPFGALMATPRDGLPVTQWLDRDQALLEVARAVRSAAERRRDKLPAEPVSRVATTVDAPSGDGLSERAPLPDVVMQITGEPRSAELKDVAVAVLILPDFLGLRVENPAAACRLAEVAKQIATSSKDPWILVLSSSQIRANMAVRSLNLSGDRVRALSHEYVEHYLPLVVLYEDGRANPRSFMLTNEGNLVAAPKYRAAMMAECVRSMVPAEVANTVFTGRGGA